MIRVGIVAGMTLLAACEAKEKPAESVQSASTAKPVVPAPEDDRKQVLQTTIALQGLATFWHSKSPVHVGKTEAAHDVPLDVLGQPVVWDGDEKSFRFTKVDLSADKARVEFAIKGEGVTGFAVLSKRNGAWVVDEKQVAEH